MQRATRTSSRRSCRGTATGSETAVDLVVRQYQAFAEQSCGAFTTAVEHFPLAKGDQPKERRTVTCGGFPSLRARTTFVVEVTGSKDGFSKLAGGKVDLAMTSTDRVPSDALALARQRGQAFSGHVLAQDGIAVVTHPGTPLTRLSLAQLKRIFAEGATSWRDFEPKTNLAIAAFRPAVIHGTSSAFYEDLGTPVPAETSAPAWLPHLADIPEAVMKAGPGAIGFTSRAAALGTEVRILEVAATDTSPATPPEAPYLLVESYPLSRPIMLFELGSHADSSLIGQFLAFAGGTEGRRRAARAGFAAPRAADSVRLLATCGSGNAAQPFSCQGAPAFTLRFAVRGVGLADIRELRPRGASLDMLKQYAERMKKESNLALLVAGHSDPAERDCSLATARMATVVKQLQEFGVPEARLTRSARCDREPLLPATSSAATLVNPRVDIYEWAKPPA